MYRQHRLRHAGGRSAPPTGIGEGQQPVSAAAPAQQVLVVDDDQATLSLYRDLLTDGGFAVTLRRRPPDDPEDVVRLQPDLILLDLVFSGEEAGWRFLGMLKNDRRTAETPVLVCTAATQLVERVRDQLDAWCCGVVLKPFDIDPLLETIELCLARPDRTQAVG
jgi:DNA-binding response OmpR family regulator